MTLSVVARTPEASRVPLYTDRFDAVRHRGLREALKALRPGLLVCHPDTFQIRYANAAAMRILEIEHPVFPRRLPDALTMTRQEEYVSAEKRHVACYRAEIADSRYDVRALPVYTLSGDVEAVLVVIRDYDGVSWSLFELLDRLPTAIASVEGDADDIRYINRTALREIYALRAQNRVKRVAAKRADPLLEDCLSGFLKAGPVSGEGRTEMQVGRHRVDMLFAKLDEAENTRLLYWDPRGHAVPRH